MKKILMIFAVTFAFTACDTNKQKTENEEVLERDTVGVTYEVEEEVVEMDTTIDVDTTTNTEEVERETQY